MASVIRSRFGTFLTRTVINHNLSRLHKNKYTFRSCLHTSSVLNVEGLSINMPSLSPTMTEGTIVKWHKKEGDTVAPGDVICDIQTDKAVMSFETEEEGILAKILVSEGTSEIKVGTLIALMVSEGEDWKAVELPNAGSATGTTTEPGSTTVEQSTGGNVPGVNISMPSLSPTMTEGAIVKWHKKEGDPVAPGDVLCDIQTDKAVMSFETEEEGILAKILIPEGTTEVKVGTLIGLMVGEGEDWTAVAIPGSAGTVSKTSVAASQSTGGNTPGINISMPSLSPTMTEGAIVKWHKKEGEAVAPGDVLCDIQTDKAVMSFETEEEGVLAKILYGEGSSGVQVGTLIALMVSEGEDWKDVMIPASGGDAIPAAAEAPQTTSATKAPVKDSHIEHGNYGPAVRILLELYQISSSDVTPTGRGKKLLKSDVLSYITGKNLKPQPLKPVPLPGKKSVADASSERSPTGRPIIPKYTDIEVSSMRRTIANRLTQSKTSIPHAYATVDASIDSLLTFQKQLKSLGISVSVNDFIIKAVALALRESPTVNCLNIKNEVTYSPTVDISIAVATESGLITPIIKNADEKGVDEISSEIRDLAKRARAGKLQLHEFQGGSFTISNLGMFEISEFSAIINPPQCGILAIGSGRVNVDINKKLVTTMTSTLSYDAQAISESAAADFLEKLQTYLQNPASLFMASAKQKSRISN